MSLNAHLAVQRNAFSTAATAPKVCDGRISHSCTLREAGVSVAKTTGTSSELQFCLMPSVTCGFWSQDGENSSAAQYHFGGPETQLNSTGLDKADVNAPDKFRLVSAALRLSCINASENNEGYFEAIRYISDGRPIDFEKVGSGGTTTTVGGASLTTQAQILQRDNAKLANGIWDSKRWPNHPTFVTGKLRDLYKHCFYLQPQQDREMNELQYVDGKSYGFDSNFDAILVRVYAISTTEVPIAVHCHSVHNWEVQYDANATNSRYHSACMSVPSAVRAVDKSLKRDPKASQIRTATNYGSKY